MSIAVSSSRSRWLLDGASAPKDNIDSRKHQVEFGSGELPGSFGEVCLVQRHKMGDVGDRLLREPRYARRQKHVPGRSRPLHVACQGNASDGRDSATVQRISLYDHHWTSEARPGAPRLRQVGPPDVTLRYSHQSLRFRMRRDTALTNSSTGSLISANARSIASVTRSGA